MALASVRYNVIRIYTYKEKPHPRLEVVKKVGQIAIPRTELLSMADIKAKITKIEEGDKRGADQLEAHIFDLQVHSSSPAGDWRVLAELLNDPGAPFR